MKRTPLLTASVAVLALVAFLAPAAFARSSADETASVRHAIVWQRDRTWHWQDVAHERRSPTIRGAQREHSVGYLHWIERRWNARRLAAYKLAHRPRISFGIAHLDLWLCIHGSKNPYGHWEARNWHDRDSGGNGHVGGLQMSVPWGRGSYFVAYAAALSPYAQMAAAERGYRANHYSRSWLLGQWYHPECLVYA